jgi:pyridoxamine 5'-phosphate oxidase
MSESKDPIGITDLADLRENYKRDKLDETHCDSDPIRQFAKWFVEARASALPEPNAMTLSTATADGRPSGRIVLLKQFDEDGFVFYTNYNSRKSDELAANPHAALTFYWAELERSVRVEGTVEKVGRETSERYFARRPKGSKLGAWVSKQSQVVAGREPIEKRLGELEAEYAGTDEVPAPGFWGGFRVLPEAIEFWQGRPNRLHDRLRYRKAADSQWRIERLWP